jgi:hypothetical protein
MALSASKLGQQGSVLGFQVLVQASFEMQNLLDFDVVQKALVHRKQSGAPSS